MSSLNKAVRGLGSSKKLISDYFQSHIAANIRAEEKQMTVYEQLIELASVPVHISALNYAKARQEQHRNDLVELLRRFD